MKWHSIKPDFKLSTYLRELAEVSYPTSSSDTDQSEPPKSSSTHAEFSSNASEIESFLSSLYGMMSETLTSDPGKVASTSLPEDSHAKTSVEPDQMKDLKEHLHRYGMRCFGTFETSDHHSYSLRTLKGLYQTDSELSSVTFTPYGMMLAGVIFTLTKPEFLIDEPEHLLLPTPVLSDYKGGWHRDNEVYQNSSLKHYLHGQFAAKSCSYSLPNPLLSEALMKFPTSWTDLKPLAKHKFLSWLREHGVL
jgi:hypothetical protein